MVEFTTAELKRHAHTARQQYEDVTGQCWEVCHTLGNILCDHGLPYRTDDVYHVEEFRFGPDNEENHFVFVLPGRYAAGVDEGQTVWVDLSLDQFNDRNKRRGRVDTSLGAQTSLDAVRVLLPDDTRRDQYTSLSEYFAHRFGE